MEKEKNIIYNRELIFDGDHFNEEKWNGKEKIYVYNNNGELFFEVEYLNGVKNGKVKEYNYNGQLKFEGEYFNGKKKEKNMIIMVDYYLKVNILMGKKKEKNIIIMGN